MLRPVIRCADEGQVDVRLFRGRKFVLGTLRSFFESLERHRIMRKVDAVFVFEELRQVTDDLVVEVLTAEERVAVGALHFEYAVTNFENRDIEGAAAKVEHHDLLVVVVLQPVGECRCGGLVDDALNVEPRDGAGFFRCLALRVVEVRRNGHNSIGHRFADVFRRGVFHLGENQRRNLLGRSMTVGNVDPRVIVFSRDDRKRRHLCEALDFETRHRASDQALAGKNSSFGVGDRLTLGDLTYELFTRARVGDHRRRCARALGVGDNFNRTPDHH